MTLTGPQTKLIQDVLLTSFDKAELVQMVQFQLGETLEQVAGGDDLTEIVFNLVQWSDRSGRLLDLIGGALAANPENLQLQELQQEASGWHLAPPEEGEPPYQGLQYFDVGDADRFFGRENLTAELVGYLGDHRFLAVIGASGSGKSSVVRAGVLPALASGAELADSTLPPKDSADWQVYILTPTARPLKALSASLTKGSESVTAQTTLIDDMRKDVRSADLYVSRLLANAPADYLLLVVDQFEELFTLCKDPDERRAFVDNLLTAAQPDGSATIIITLRADFYHRCAEFENLRMALANGQTYSNGNSWIEAMAPDELRAAIEKPAALGNWDFEPGLVDVLLADVENEPGALPLLSHALLETWNNRRGRSMTFAGYYEAGGVKGAIATRADTEFNDLDADEQAVARNIFVRLTELGEGSEDTRRRVSRQELLGTGKDSETVDRMLTTLGAARLITVDQDEVEVAHEALIREWPALRGWLEENREGLHIHRRLTETAEEWDGSGRKPGDLYRGTRLDQTVAWAKANEDSLNDLERAFLNDSTEQVDAARREKERVAQEREEARERELKAAQALAIESAARQEAEANRAAEAEARLAAEEKSRKAAQDREQAEKERAIASEQSARSLRRRSWWLAGVLIVALVAIAGMLLFFFVAIDSIDEAQANADLAEARLSQTRAAVDSISTDQLVEIVQTLEQAGDFSGAALLAVTAVELNPELLGDLDLNELPDGVLQIFVIGVSQRIMDQEMSGSPEPTVNLGEAAEKMLNVVELRRANFVDSNGARYVTMPAGEFVMGSGPEDAMAYSDENPPHVVDLDAYWIMQTEVTNAQYQRCVENGPCEEPGNSEWDDPTNAQRPVTDVSWSDANTYAKWVDGRLPTEAEWELACRSTDARLYPWGDTPPSETLGNYDYYVGATSDVGRYPPGANYLYDMSGNVAEWTADWYDSEYYVNSPEGNPQGPESGDSRTSRGGSWTSTVQDARCTYRNYLDPDTRNLDLGFRVVSSGP